jgi:2-polyprenyl-3-methyl-5-hydroxy-6-metoxy-1,4-benzoquinol methylase
MSENDTQYEGGFWPNNLVLGLGCGGPTGLHFGVGWRLPRGSSILDLGCGNGQNAKWLAACGFKITAVDKSEDFIERVKTRPEAINAWYQNINAEIKTELADILTWLFDHDQKYDAIICMNILQQLPEEKIPEIIKRIQEMTMIKGFNAIAAIISDNPREWAERVENGGSSFQQCELNEYYDNSNWSVINYAERKTKPERHCGGEEHRHHVVEMIAQKA